MVLTATLVASLPARASEPARTAAALQPFVDRHTLAGAVTLAATKDKVLSLEAVGFADIAGKKPMRTDALFWIASQSKPLTATALMMLVDEIHGQAALRTPWHERHYLPAESAPTQTPRQVL